MPQIIDGLANELVGDRRSVDDNFLVDFDVERHFMRGHPETVCAVGLNFRSNTFEELAQFVFFGLTVAFQAPARSPEVIVPIVAFDERPPASATSTT